MMITGTQIQELRGRTGMGIMLCKEALVATDGDLDGAIAYLRIKMGNKLTELDPSTASEGVIAISLFPDFGSIAKLTCQTDFVAKNEDFVEFAYDIARAMGTCTFNADRAGNTCSVDDVVWGWDLSGPQSTIKERITDLYGKFREPIALADVRTMVNNGGEVISGYIHSTGKVGAIVKLAYQPSVGSDHDHIYDEIMKIGASVGMQIVASKPKWISREEVPEGVTDQEVAIYRTQLLNEGKPEASFDRIMPGKLNKFYGEKCLLDQPYVREPKKTVAQYLKDTGLNLTVVDFNLLSI